MESKPIQIGVVGVNFGAAVHVPAFQSEGLEVIAVCSRRQERAAEAVQRFGVEHAFTDLDEMLRLDGLDAVSIVSPVALHHEHALAALAAGKHVICEKPFTTEAALAKEMWERARSTGLTTMIAHEFRFASGRMRAKELIDEGYVGRLNLVLLRLLMGARPGSRSAEAAAIEGPPPYSATRDSLDQGAGFLWSLGSHYIDCLRHWFGEVESVSGELVNSAPDRSQDGNIVQADADDKFLFTLHFADGGYAQMNASRGARFGSGATIEVYGSDGTIVTPQTGLNPPAHGKVLAARAGDDGLAEQPIPERLQPFADERDDRLMPFRLLVREFARGIREGTSPAPNFYDGYRCQQILNAVRESTATGRRVPIDLAG